MEQIDHRATIGDRGQKKIRQAGAELCQAQFKLGLAMPTD